MSQWSGTENEYVKLINAITVKITGFVGNIVEIESSQVIVF